MIKALLLFTQGVSLQDWYKSGKITREVKLYKWLEKKGIKYQFLTYGDEEDYKLKQYAPNIKIIPISQYVKTENYLIEYIKAIFLPLRRKELFDKIDLIKTNQVKGWWIGLLPKLFYGKKLIIRGGYEWLRNTIGAAKIQIRDKSIITKIKEFFYLLFVFLNEFLAYKLADKIILTNKSDIKFITRLFNLDLRKVCLIPNFVNVGQFKPLGIKKKDKRILFIGRLTIEKNLSNLFKAINGLDRFGLDIIGTGPIENYLKSLAEKLEIDVNFLGVVANENLPETINQYEIFILPSLYECNPKALMEAMSCGLVCIGTKVRGITDLIIPKKNGFLCNPNFHSIRNTVNYVYKKKGKREIVKNEARKTITENYSFEFTSNKEFVLYKKILKTENHIF